MKITCNIIEDLLPSYADQICSEDSCRLIEEHIRSCESCKQKLEHMSGCIEEPPNIQRIAAAKEPFQKIKKKNRLHIAVAAAIAVVLTSCVFYFIVCIADNVEVLRDFFYPQVFVTINNDKEQEEWTRLYVPDEGVLQFSSIFSSKEVTNYADSVDEVSIRILDENGNIIMDETIVEPGKTVSLNTLKRGKPYCVETKCSVGRNLLVFH